ncbi:MFS transporter [Scopulibacillus cellulosilyticus]|uniref:MFS transporter n=1 Tax=Scopulibacillus cellulosilyticus TaxID=2665665 RepID=A0ABW2PWH3_9BACL
MRGKYRYLIMILLMIITIINFVDRGAISYSQSFIIKEYGLNPVKWGEILGYFGYGYMFGALLGGALSDKKGPKFVWLTAVIAWSIFEIGIIYAGNIGMALFGGSALAGFAVFRILFGFAEGPAFSTLNRTVANWAAPKEKAFLFSIGSVGVPIGAIIAAPVSVGLISLAGWRMAFVILGALGIIWAMMWAKIFTNRPENHPRVSQEELQKIKSSDDLKPSSGVNDGANKPYVPWYHFFKSRTMILISIGYFTFQYINFLILTWPPKYLQDVFHFKLQSLWYLGMIPWIGACFTLPLGSKISDILLQKTGSLRIARSGVTVVSLILTAVCFVLIPTVSSPWAVLTLMAVGNALAFLPSSLFWIIILDTETVKAGTYTGLMHFFSNIAAIVAPTLTGVLVMDYGYSAMFIAASIVTLIGALVMFFVKPGHSVNNSQVLKKADL